jgi:hypothetical protein
MGSGPLQAWCSLKEARRTRGMQLSGTTPTREVYGADPRILHNLFRASGAATLE